MNLIVDKVIKSDTIEMYITDLQEDDFEIALKVLLFIKIHKSIKRENG